MLHACIPHFLTQMEVLPHHHPDLAPRPVAKYRFRCLLRLQQRLLLLQPEPAVPSICY